MNTTTSTITNANTNANTTTNINANNSKNIILDLARLRGQEIKDIQQYYSAFQSQRIQSNSGKNLEVLNYNPEKDKDNYKSYFIEPKCGSC